MTVEDNTKYFFDNIPSDVTIIAVTKTVGVDNILKAIKSGIKNIGENKVQEAYEKYSQLKDEDIKWHLIGHLQTNKVRKAVEIFDLIHSVDTLNLAQCIGKEAEKIGKTQKILLQLNISEEETKSGFSKEDFFSSLNELNKIKGIEIKGLMTIGVNNDDESKIRDCFRTLNLIKEQVNNDNHLNMKLEVLSMGMTNDYKIAIEEGSNMIRLGRAIFGERNY